MSGSLAKSEVVPQKILPWIAPLIGAIAVLIAGYWLVSSLVAVSLLVCAASIYMMHRLVGIFDLRRLNIASFFYLVYVSIILIPGFFVFQDEVTGSRMSFLFGMESVLISVPIGIFLANQIAGFDIREIARYFDRPVVAESRNTGLFAAIFVLGLVIIALNIRETPAVPLFYLLRNPGEALTAATLREDAFKLLNSPLMYVYYVFRGSVFPFLAMLALGRYRVTKQRVWNILFWMSLLTAVGYAALTIEKAPVAAIFGMLFLFSYLLKGGRLSKKAAIIFPALFLAFPAMVVLLAYQGTEGGTLGGLFHAIADRIFFGPAQVVYAYFEMFPALIPYQHGASLVKVAHLMGWQTMDIPNVVGLYMTEGTDELASVTANSCFIGNLNADFGLPGVALGGVLAGMVMQATTVHFFRRPKTVARLVGYATCMWSFGFLVANPLQTVLLSGGVAFALLLTWCLG